MSKKMYRVDNVVFDTLENARSYVRAEWPCPTPEQRMRLAEIAKGNDLPCPETSRLPSEFSLRPKMPPVYNQGTRGTCVANAATALAEYHSDCKWRFSVQYLFEMMKQREVEVRNQSAREVLEGRSPSDARMSRRVRQIADSLSCRRRHEAVRMASAAGMPLNVEDYMHPVTNQDIASAILGMEVVRDGSFLNRAFEVLSTKGICTYDYWPYARTQLDRLSVVDGNEVSDLPPGAEENAKMHIIPAGFYLLRSPNNVEELKRLLTGAGNRRPMPVCAGIDVYGSLVLKGDVVQMPALADKEIYEEEYEARFVDAELTRYRIGAAVPGTMSCVAREPVFAGPVGGHEVVFVGYRDDASLPGGGAFEMRNSWDETWGDGGYAWLPYAYVEMFCDEAGTIVQTVEDYKGDGYGGAVGANGDIPEDLRPYIVRADREMKNSRGVWQITKGTRIILDADGIAEPDNELNRRRFVAQGYSWREAPRPAAAGTPSAPAVSPQGAPEHGRFASGFESAFKKLPIDFPLLGGVKKGGFLSSRPKADTFKKIADKLPQLGDWLNIYDVSGKKTHFRVAAAYLSNPSQAGEKAERIRQIVDEYAATRRFDPCDCTITVVASSADISAAVQPYLSDSDVRIVADAYSDRLGWRVHAVSKSGDDAWIAWLKRLVPNMPEQWRAQLTEAWQSIAEGGGHVTPGKMADKLGLPEDAVVALVGEFMPDCRIKGGHVVKV